VALLLSIQVEEATCLHADLFTNPFIQRERLFASLAGRFIFLGNLAVDEAVVVSSSHRQVNRRNGSVVGADRRVCLGAKRTARGDSVDDNRKRLFCESCKFDRRTDSFQVEQMGAAGNSAQDRQTVRQQAMRSQNGERCR